MLINGQTVPLLYVSDRQINFYVPLAVSPGPATNQISTPLGDTAETPVEIREFSPGVFVMPGTGLGAVTIAGTGKVTSERPATSGDFLEIFCTGLGAVDPSSSVSLRRTLVTPDVTVGGFPAEIQFSGLAPGFVGLYQVNARFPTGVASGRQLLTLSIGGLAANSVEIMVQ